LTSICAPLLPGAPAPASRHPNDDRGVQCAGILSLLAQTLPGLPGNLPRPKTTSARFGGAFRFPWPFGVVRSTGAPPAKWAMGAPGRPIGGDRGPWALTVLSDSRGTIRKPGDGRLQTPHAAWRRPRETSPTRIGGPVRSEMIRMWLRRVVTLPFPDSHGRIGPYDRGYRLGSPWAGIMAPRRPVRSDVMMGCWSGSTDVMAAGLSIVCFKNQLW